MAVITNDYVWPDSAGTATDPTTSYVAATTLPTLAPGGEVLLKVVVAGTDCLGIDLKAEISFDGETYEEWAVRTIPGASIGTHYARMSLPAKGVLRLSARRWGGTGATLQVFAYVRAAFGSMGRNGQPVELRTAFQSGIEGFAASDVARTMSDTMIAGQACPVGDSNEALIEYTVSGASSATSVDFQVETSTDDGTTYAITDAVNGAPAAGAVDFDAAINVGPGGNGTHERRINLTPGSVVRPSVRQIGGLAGACLLKIKPYKV